MLLHTQFWPSNIPSTFCEDLGPAQVPTLPAPVLIDETLDEEAPCEEVQVAAGIGATIFQVLRKSGAKTSKRLDDVIEEGATAGALNKNYAIVREASDDEVAEFDRLIGKTEGVPSPTPGQKAQGIPAAAVFVSSDAATCFCRPPD